MIDYDKLKKLREQSGVSFSLCKRALEKSNNDIEKANKILLDWGEQAITDKSQKITSQGAIFSYVHHNKKLASLVELLCETDFVAGNSDFQKLGMELAMQVVSIPAKTVNELLKQEYIRDPTKNVSQLLKEAVLKFGENIKIARFSRWQQGNYGPRNK